MKSFFDEKSKGSSLLTFITGSIAGGVVTLTLFLVVLGFFKKPKEVGLSGFRPHQPVLPRESDEKATVGMRGLPGLVVRGFRGTDTPAEKAGLKVGDVIWRLNNHQVSALEDFYIPVALEPPGTVHDFYVFRVDNASNELKSHTIKVVSVPINREPVTPPMPAADLRP